MDHEIHSILERLRLIESDITPTNVKSGLNKQQKSVKQMPALFKPKTQKILGGDASAPNPMSGYMVGGCEESEEQEEKHLEEESSEDMLTKVKASFADYLHSLEDNIKQDKDLLAKKKEDFDLKKKKMKDLELQIKAKKEEAEQVDEYEELEEDQMQLEVGDPICVIGNNEYRGEFGVIEEFAPSGKFVVIQMRDGSKVPMHLADVELTDDGGDDYDNGDDDNDEDDSEFVEEGDAERYEVTYYDKNGRADDSSKRFDDRTKADAYAARGNSVNKVGGEYRVHKVGADIDEGDTYAQGGNSTYAECVMPVVKTVAFEDGSSCTVHGDEDNGFIIRRGEKQLPSKFGDLNHALMALDMFKARQAEKQQGDDSSDYVEEK